MNSMKKNLLYITSQYPNVFGDTAFINTEIKYLSKVFDNIIVLSHGDKSIPCVEVPKNVIVKFFKKKDEKKPLALKIIFCVPLLFKTEFWKEFMFLINQKKKLSCLKLTASFLRQALAESKEIESIIRDYDINMLYTFWYHHSTFAGQLALKHMGLVDESIRICTRTHGFDLYEFRNSYHYQPFKIQMDKKICKVFFISMQGMEYYKKTFAIKDDDVYKLCYLGIENSISFVPHDYTDTIELLSISNLIPIKRVHLIVHSLAQCITLGIKINWTHIGSGAEEDVLSTLAKEKLGTQGFISYNFLGSKTNEEVMEYYKNNLVDLFVNMSESEGLPVSMMEAMSFGVPVIAPDVGGIKEIVDENSGWLLSCENCSAEFVEVIKRWKDLSKEERQKKAFAAYEKWNTTFNAKKNYNVFAKQLLSL